MDAESYGENYDDPKNLVSLELGDIRDVTAEGIDRILPEDTFGKFAALSFSKDSFSQAGNDWHCLR